MTTANVITVKIVSGQIQIKETNGTTTTDGATSRTNAINLLKSTDSTLDARQQCHAALRAHGFTGTLGNFGG